MCLAAFTYRSSIFTARDCQRQHLANKVTKVSEQGWAGRVGAKKKKKDMASRHSIPQRTCVRRLGGREKADEESVMDKVKMQKKKGTGREIKQKRMT